MKRLENIQWIAIATLVGAGLVLAWQINEKDTPPDATTLGVLLILVVATAALLDPLSFRRLSRRITAFEGFGVKVGLEVERARSVDARFPADDDGVRVEQRTRRPGEPDLEVRDVIRKLRARVRFVVDAVLGEGELIIQPRDGFEDLITEQPLIARLESIGLLDRQEAQLAHELLGDLGKQLPEWEGIDRDQFLDNAWSFASRLTTGLFDRYARRQFKAGGWYVADFEQGKGHRPEFIVIKDQHWARVAARVADPANSKSMQNTVNRLASEPDSKLPRPVVVVPDHVDGLREEIGPESPVMLADGKVIAARLSCLVQKPELLKEEMPGPVVDSLDPSGAANDAEEPDEVETEALTF